MDFNNLTNTEPMVTDDKVHITQKSPDNYSITVNLANHTLTVIKSGKPLKSYPVAIGKSSTPTPRGTYKIINKAFNLGGPFGARWLGLNIPGGRFWHPWYEYSQIYRKKRFSWMHSYV